MKPTLQYVKDKFGEFNELIFGGALEMPPIKLSPARTTLGKLCYRKKRGFFGKVTYSDYKLLISSALDLDESLVEDTIIHEMIHYHIAVNGIKDTSSHGKVFRSMMSDINTRFGRHITISHKFSEAEREANADNKPRLVCISRFKDGRVGVTVASRTRFLKIKSDMTRVPQLSESRWYFTQDSYFSRFPRALTAKVYIVAESELKEHTGELIPLKEK